MYYTDHTETIQSSQEYIIKEQKSETNPPDTVNYKHFQIAHGSKMKIILGIKDTLIDNENIIYQNL